MAALPDSSLVAAGAICLVVLGAAVAGPPPAPPAGVGEGNATLSVLEPTTGELRTSPGRFGTRARYLRTPDLVADVTTVAGHPRVVYRLAVPALGVDRQVTEVVTTTGRVRLRMPDRAYPPESYSARFRTLPPAGTYEGRLVVRVQSFSGDRTVRNRTVPVRVGR